MNKRKILVHIVSTSFMFTLTNHFTYTNQNKNGEKFHMSLCKRNKTILQISHVFKTS